MQEAWLLFDESALRRAAGNPHGRNALRLPPLARLEDLPNPKQDLYDLMREASGLRGKRRRRSPLSARRVAEFIEDFSPLRSLPAFSALEEYLARAIVENHWNE